MKTILVSGASGIVGYGVLKSLKGNTDVRLIGTTIYDDSIAPAFCDIFEKAPLTSDPFYIDWLCSVIKRLNVNMIIPGIEDDMYKWANNRDIIEKTGVKVLLNNINLIHLCNDKWLFYEKLIEEKSYSAIPSRLEGDFKTLEKDFGLPFLLKPRKGFASKGIVKVVSEEIFNENKDNLGEYLMAQPLIGNDEREYTTSAFFDSESNLLSFMTLRRKLSKEGFTEKAQVTDVPGIEECINKLGEIFKPVGPTNFQFRIDKNNELKLLEINPRISSATSIRSAFGYNESLMSINYFLDNIYPQKPIIRLGVAIRYTEEHIFYDRNHF